MLPYAVYLRVYEPVSPSESAATQRVVDAGLDTSAVTLAQQRQALLGVTRSAQSPAVQAAGAAFALRYDGRTFLAPAADEAGHVRVATWRPPLGWLVLVADSDLHADPSDGHPRFRTPMPYARRRAGRAVAALRRHDPEGELLGALRTETIETARWLERFGGDGVVELDLAGLGPIVRDLDPDEPIRSAREVADTMDALAAGRTELAADMHSQLRERWATYALRERAS